jgi:hypothetical protein
MRAGNSQRCLTAVAHSLGNAGKEKRPAGDGFQMLVGFGQPHEQVPPVVDQRDHACDETAACQILCCEPAPAPLVLQFVKYVLAICPIAIKLRDGEHFLRERGDEHSVFVQLGVGADLRKADCS